MHTASCTGDSNRKRSTLSFTHLDGCSFTIPNMDAGPHAQLHADSFNPKNAATDGNA